MRWLSDGSLKFTAPGYNQSNWIRVKQPRKQKNLQSAYDVTNGTIGMLKLTIKGTPGVETYNTEDTSYEETELKSHLKIKKQIEEAALELKVRLVPTQELSNFTKLEAQVDKVLKDSRPYLSSNIKSTVKLAYSYDRRTTSMSIAVR